MSDAPMITTQEVEPFKASIEVTPDDWYQNGTCWDAIIECPGIRENGITNCYPDEEKMKEQRDISFVMKMISDILAENKMEIKTENDIIKFAWLDNVKPRVCCYFDFEQLPFD